MIPITTNAIARKQATHDERMKTIYAFEAHKAMLADRIKETQSDIVRQAIAWSIIELDDLLNTIKAGHK